MFNFINYIRVIATILITNSHFSNIWPIKAMAAGGLLGNILFFAVSGFCLYLIKENFIKWFVKRIARIYPALITVTLLTVFLGFYRLGSLNDAVRLFIYPTNYIFIVWLMVCYIPFYLLAVLDKKYNKTLEISFLVVIALWIITYIFFIDKSAYTIDNVEKPFIIFLYFTSMIMGALFRKHYSKFTKFKVLNVVFLGLSLIVYFASKIAFSKWAIISSLQILNQVAILVALYFIFAVLMGLENKLEKLPIKVNNIVKYVGGLTLQIYLVQFVIIRKFSSLVFPLNLAIVVLLIFIFASLVYSAEYFIRKFILSFSKNKKVKNDKY